MTKRHGFQGISAPAVSRSAFSDPESEEAEAPETPDPFEALFADYEADVGPVVDQPVVEAMEVADDPAGSDGPALDSAVDSSLPDGGSARGVGPSRPADFPDPIDDPDDPDARASKYARISQAQADLEFSSFTCGSEVFHHNAEEPPHVPVEELEYLESTYPWEPESEALTVPDALWRPLSQEEPQVPPEELAYLDSLAGDF